MSNLDKEEMMQAGLHLGHRTSKLHPKMEDFVVGIKNTVHVIDIEKTEEYFKRALEFIESLVKEKKVFMIVGTKPPLRNLIKTKAKEANLPYVVGRWLGGTFTNFEVLSKRVEYFKSLKEKKEKGEMDKYTKKERIKMNKEMADLETKFGGVEHLTKLPDAVFLCDLVKDKLALKEAKEMGVKIVGISDTNADISSIDFPIPANDDAISSVSYILDKIIEVIKKHED